MGVSSSESHDLTAFYEMLSASFGVLSQNTGFYPSLDRIIETTLGPLNLGPGGGSYNEPISRLHCATWGAFTVVDGVGTLNHATNPNYPDTEPRMSRIKTRTGPSVSGSTVAKTHFSNQNKLMNPLFQKLDRP